MGTSLEELEQLVAGPYACATASVQIAVQSCLELLGTRVDVIPVVMPVTSAPDTLAAVLRAGGHPLLLDIEEEHLQMDPAQLKDALEMLEEQKRVPVILFNRPFRMPVREELLEIVADYPSVSDARVVPGEFLSGPDIACTFNVFDLSTVCGAGALTIHGFPEQVDQLKLVRSGPMGLDGALPEMLAEEAVHVHSYWQITRKHYWEEVEKFQGTEHHVMGPSTEPGVVWLKVDNARRTAATLKSYDIEAVIGLAPLYEIEEVKCRYQEEPEYPVTKALENSFVCFNYEDIEKALKVL